MGNERIICDLIKRYSSENRSILIFPELALSGYLPLDQLYNKDFLSQITESINRIVEVSNENIIIFGGPRLEETTKIVYNSAYVVQNKKIINIINKTLLPNYNVFHEKRYFLPGLPSVIDLFGIKVGLQICEDMWDKRPEHLIKVTQEQKQMGAELFINISASPYTDNKPARRLTTVRDHIKSVASPFVYVNLVGSQDDVVFDGRSFAINSEGGLVFSAHAFEEGAYTISFNGGSNGFENTDNLQIHDNLQNEGIYNDFEKAISLSLRDYLRKNQLSDRVIIALSGGIDSALTATLAKLALGSQNVIGVYMPTKFSSNHSRQDAKKLADNLGIEFHEFSIDEINAILSQQLHEQFKTQQSWSIADENLQARIRGVILMYLSNSLNALVLSTGNKSEIACGYSTLYGDSIGGKNLIGDLFKTEVYEFARHLNEKYNLIPQSSINKVPSAELRENQKDSDSLPEYDVLDPILRLYLEDQKSKSAILALGYDRELVERILRLIRISEFKRAQICQTVKLKRRSFDIGRIFPITSQFSS